MKGTPQRKGSESPLNTSPEEEEGKNRKRKLSLAIAPSDLVAVKKCHISTIIIEQAAATAITRETKSNGETN